MPRSSKRASSSSDSGSGDSAVAKKQKKDSADGEVVEEEEDITISAAVSPIAEPESAPSSAQVKTEEEAPAISDDHKTILQVLKNVKKNPTRVDTVKAAFGFLHQLVQGNNDEDLMKCIIDADGILVVVTIMKDNPKEEALWTEGRALLDFLCKTVKEKPEKEGIEAILLAMKTLPGDAALQTKCCDILWDATKSGFHKFIGEAGGIPLVLAALKNHPDEEKLLEKGLGALGRLAFHSNRVADAGGIAVVTDTLGRHKNNSKVKYGIVVLLNLACNSEERTKSIIEAGGHVAVITFMTNHPQDEQVQFGGCHALANLALNEIDGVNKKMVDAGAIPVVVKAMKQHPTSVGVQRGACIFFESLSNGGRDILAAMNEAGARSVLAAAIDSHSKNENIRMWAKEAWVRLVDSLPYE